ncbi:MAG: hypothetical protein QW303_07125, partial [Nitrososphaerota archaeon]
ATSTGIYYNGGNVGIGTTTPKGTLHTKGTLYITGTDAYTPANVPALHIDVSDTALFVPTTTGGNLDLRLYIDDDATDRFSIWGNSCGGGGCQNLAYSSEVAQFRADGQIYLKGNVGIGTAAPGSKLAIQDGSSFPVITLTNGTSAYYIGRSSYWMTDGAAGDLGIGGGGGNIKFGASSATQMVITTSGNVGIGTTGPNRKLEVFNGVDGGYNIDPIRASIIYGGTPHSAGIGIDAGGTYWGTSIFQDGTARLTIESNGGVLIGGSYQTSSAPANGLAIEGNVGIGTTSPKAKLDLGSSGGSVFVLNPGSAASPIYTGFAHNDLIIGSYLSGGYSQGFLSTGYSADPNRKFHIGTASDSNFNGSTTFVPQVTFTSGGNVGIGTTAPGQKLTVAGGWIEPAAGYGLNWPNDAWGGGGDDAWIQYYSEGGENTKLMIGISNDADDDIGFYQAGAERMTIYNGNVGIGTTSPQAALHVAGTFRAFDAVLIRPGASPTIFSVQWSLPASTETAMELMTANYGDREFNFRWDGQAYADQNFTGGGADVAEVYLVKGPKEPGDLVEIPNPEEVSVPGKTLKVHEGGAYNSRVVGVVSTFPGLRAGLGAINPGETEDKDNTDIALVGRVPVKVNLENGPIKAGDPLTASSQRGVAMKATQGGFIIGRALEDYDGSTKVSRGVKLIEDDYYANVADATPIPEPPDGVGKIMAYIQVGFWSPTYYIAASLPDSGHTNTPLETIDVLKALAQVALDKIQSLWAAGDIIAEGVRKTYYSVASAFDWQFDLGNMVENWLTREITISPTADDASRALFSGSGTQAAKESKLDLKQEGDGAYLVTYGVDSARGEIMLSGSASISGGEAKIYFDSSFTSVISDKIPLKVFVTPTTNMQGQLYVAQKTVHGFVVKSSSGSADGQFDWLVIARRKGYE